MNKMTQKTLGVCCPIFHAEKWDGKTFNWDSKQFIQASVPTLFHIPFPPMMGKKITKLMAQAEEADKLQEDREEILLLFCDPHPFKSNMYLSVTAEVPNANNVTMSGTFESKVFEGDYSSIPKFIKQMNAHLSEQGKKAKRLFMHYAYCPKCAKEAGRNYIVLFAEV